MYRASPIIRWRRYNDNYRLVGNKCKCGKVYYPARQFCVSCKGKEFSEFEFGGKGKLLTFSEVKAAPEKFSSKAPYCVGIVELKEGPKIATQIADCNIQDLKIGMELEASFRKFYASGEDGVIHYGTKFAPIF